MMSKQARVIKTGKVGTIVKKFMIGGVRPMFEISFLGQLWTQCYWDSEIELV